MSVRTLVLSGYGINCERETAYAFELAGAKADCVHLNDLIAAPEQLDRYEILAVPGGFSFGDDVASGRILANRLRYRLGDALQRFVADEKLLIGICNGFQVLVKMGLLPWPREEYVQDVTLTHNDSDCFEDRWVHLSVEPDSVCVWTRGIAELELPVRHGEGKFIARDADTIAAMADGGQIVLRYSGGNGAPASGTYPANPNGSVDDIAGICDPSGRIFGLMPHPEAYVEGFQHPRWTREGLAAEGAGLAIFKNAVAHAAAPAVAR